MQNSRFVVLTGHLNDYPLSDLVGILRYQRKTGRLMIEYPKAPATFYFQDGELVDVQLDSLSGLQAICVALAQPASPFNFNSLIRPSRRSIESSLQRVVSELFGCWDLSPLQIDSLTTAEPLPGVQPANIAATLPAEPAELKGVEVRALPPYVPPVTTQSRVMVMTAAGIMMLGLSSVIAVTGGFRGRAESIAPAGSQLESKPRPSLENQGEHLQNPHTEPRRNSTVENQVSKEQSRRRDDNVMLSRQTKPRNAETSIAISAKETTPVPGEETSKSKKVAASYQLVDVVMQIENGRVLQAAVSNHKSEMDGYESMALRIARQRRYSATTTGQETIRIKVGQAN
jgi:hypothetical protein